MKIFTISHNSETQDTLFHEDGKLVHTEKRGALTLEDLVSITGTVLNVGSTILGTVRKTRKTRTLN